MKGVVKKVARRFGFQISRYRAKPHANEPVCLKTNKPPRGNVLLSYRIEPFLLQPGGAIPNSHTNYWVSLAIANIFLEMGYNVDAIDFKNRDFVPKKDYSLFLDVRHNLERLEPYLSDHCIKIFHIDTAHILFHNAAEAKRLLALQQRRGITLKPKRFEMPNLGIEHAHCAISQGNKFVLNTFGYAQKTIYRTPYAASVSLPWPVDKDFERCRKNFLWFGSGGFVHKGLDLVLESFAKMPELRLTVCGPIQREKDFEKAYHKELYGTPNIRTLGWVNVDSEEFRKVVNESMGLVYPSCSEGGSTSSVNCMHAGLIPVLSYESGVDIDGFGIILKESSIEEIMDAVRGLADQPVRSLTRMSRDAWTFVKENNTQEQFVKKYSENIHDIVSTYGTK